MEITDKTAPATQQPDQNTTSLDLMHSKVCFEGIKSAKMNKTQLHYLSSIYPFQYTSVFRWILSFFAFSTTLVRPGMLRSV